MSELAKERYREMLEMPSEKAYGVAVEKGQPPSSMLGRVAIALSMADPDSRGLPDWADMATFYRGLARAAIAAMRDAPDAQLFGLAADKAQEVRGTGATWPYSFREGYRALFDAALTQPKEG